MSVGTTVLGGGEEFVGCPNPGPSSCLLGNGCPTSREVPTGDSCCGTVRSLGVVDRPQWSPAWQEDMGTRSNGAIHLFSYRGASYAEDAWPGDEGQEEELLVQA